MRSFQVASKPTFPIPLNLQICNFHSTYVLCSWTEIPESILQNFISILVCLHLIISQQIQNWQRLLRFLLHAPAWLHTTEKGKKKSCRSQVCHPSPEWSYLSQSSAISLWEALSVGSRQWLWAALLVLSCHADVGWRLSWLPVDLQAAKHNDQRWLTVTLTYIKWFCRFSDWRYCCNCCASQLRGWHGLGSALQPCWVRLLVSLGLRPCPHPAKLLLSHQIRQQKGASLGHIWHFSAEASLQECFAYRILIDSD